MDFWRENTIITAIFLCLALLIPFYLAPSRAEAAEAEQKIGQSDAGVVYIFPSSVQILKKDGNRYLVAAVEERYTDQAFLADLHSDESTQSAVAELNLYMFTSDGRYYCVVQRCLLDSEGKICADLGGDMQLQMISDKFIADIYMAALDVLKQKAED